MTELCALSSICKMWDAIGGSNAAESVKTIDRSGLWSSSTRAPGATFLSQTSCLVLFPSYSAVLGVQPGSCSMGPVSFVQILVFVQYNVGIHSDPWPNASCSFFSVRVCMSILSQDEDAPCTPDVTGSVETIDFACGF